MRTAEQLLREAMQLSDEERGSLAVELLDSISPPDPRTDEEWVAVIERRAMRAMTAEAAGDRTVEDAVATLERDLEL